jgi:hypothetical protein
LPGEDRHVDTPRFDRRGFLRTSIRAGIGTAGIGLVGGGPLALLGDAQATAAPAGGATLRPRIAPPATPPAMRRFVTRPDLTPPGVTVSRAAGFPYTSSQPPYIFMAPRAIPGYPYPGGAQPGLMILDLKGDLVWFQPQTGANTDPFNFRVQTYKDKPVITWFQGTVSGFGTAGEYVIADAFYNRVATVSATGWPCDNHEFILTPDDTALHTAYETGVAGPDGASIIVGHAQEVDVATNQLLRDWPSYPGVSPSESYGPPSGDYFHINSIDLWPGADRNLLISARNTSTVYLVDGTSGAILWRFSGKHTSFAMGAGTPSSYQHDARALADGSGISLFDDASQPSREKVSSGKVITLDQSTKRATLRHQYIHPNTLIDTPSQGNCQLLVNGFHVVGWGAAKYFTCFRSSGTALTAEVVLDGSLPVGVGSYRSFMFDWTGYPAQDELRVVVRPTAGSGHFTAWVSWNGATEVAKWRLNAGPSASSLDVIKTVDKTSFETAINFTRSGAKAFRISALDRNGAVITRSSVVSAT